MSYIINTTTYEDPEFSIQSMDLQELLNIYKNKINNYFSSYNKLKEINSARKIVYSTDEILDCIFYINNNILYSSIPLFIYLTIQTEDWTVEKDIIALRNEFIINFKDVDLYNYLLSLINNYMNKKQLLVLEYYIKDYEKLINNLPDTYPEKPIKKNNLEYFLQLIKNDCIVNINKPYELEVININTSQMSEADIKQFNKKFLNSDSVIVDSNTNNMYDAVTKSIINIGVIKNG